MLCHACRLLDKSNDSTRQSILSSPMRRKGGGSCTCKPCKSCNNIKCQCKKKEISVKNKYRSQLGSGPCLSKRDTNGELVPIEDGKEKLRIMIQTLEKQIMLKTEEYKTEQQKQIIIKNRGGAVQLGKLKIIKDMLNQLENRLNTCKMFLQQIGGRRYAKSKQIGAGIFSCFGKPKVVNDLNDVETMDVTDQVLDEVLNTDTSNNTENTFRKQMRNALHMTRSHVQPTEAELEKELEDLVSRDSSIGGKKAKKSVKIISNNH